MLLSGVIIALVIGAAPALGTFGFSFLFDESWNPVTERFGALAPIYGTLITSAIAMLIAVPVGLMIAFFLTELCPMVLRRPIGIAIELLAGIPSIIYGIWGLFIFAPFVQKYIQPPLIDTFENIPVLNSLFAGPPYGIGMATAGMILAIMVLPFVTSISRDVFDAVPPVLKEAAYGVGCTTWEVFRNVVLPFTRVGVIGGFMLGLGRALGETMAVTFVIGNAHHVSASLFAPGTTISASIANEFTEAVGDLYTSSLVALGLILFFITFIVLAIARYMLLRLQQKGGVTVMANTSLATTSPLYSGRRRRNAIAKTLAWIATAFGLGWLVLILGILLFARHRRAVALGVHREHAAAGRGGRPAERHHGQPDHHRAGRRDRHADRHPGRHLPRRVRPARQALERRALHQRHPAERAVDRDRPVHLRDHGGADGPLLGLGGRRGAGGDRDPRRGAHHRGHADPGARHAARGRRLDRPAARADDHAHRLSRGRAPASSPASCWRSRASAARPRRCCSRR